LNPYLRAPLEKEEQPWGIPMFAAFCTKLHVAHHR
jgi:hypothetical protein